MNYNLQLLIIVDPINPKNENITLPIFLLFYDSDNQLIEKKYYRLKEKLIYDDDLSTYNITELVSEINIYHDSGY